MADWSFLTNHVAAVSCSQSGLMVHTEGAADCDHPGRTAVSMDR